MIPARLEVRLCSSVAESNLYGSQPFRVGGWRSADGSEGLPLTQPTVPLDRICDTSYAAEPEDGAGVGGKNFVTFAGDNVDRLSRPGIADAQILSDSWLNDNCS